MPFSRGPVFIVDDDAAVRNSLKFALELEGLEVCVYDSGEALLAEPGLPSSGCLVVDYYMPAMDGVELIDRLRNQDVNLPVILMTAEITQDLHDRALRHGVRHILEKPLEDAALVDSIRKVLGAPGNYG